MREDRFDIKPVSDSSLHITTAKEYLVTVNLAKMKCSGRSFFLALTVACCLCRSAEGARLDKEIEVLVHHPPRLQRCLILFPV